MVSSTSSSSLPSSRVVSQFTSRSFTTRVGLLGGLVMGAALGFGLFFNDAERNVTPTQFSGTEADKWNKEVLDKLKRAEELKKKNSQQ